MRTSVASGYNTVIGKDQSASPFAAQFRLWMVNGPSSFQGISGGQYGGTFSLPTPVNNGQWHLLTMVNLNDGGTWRTRLYQNDSTGFNQTNAGTLAPLPDLWRVGDTTRGGNGWRGQLDDLRIYKRALTQAEIAALYTAPVPQTFGGWLTANLTPQQLADPLQNGTAHDADGNGVANLIEFVAPQPLAVLHGGANAELTFTRNAAARGVTLIVERSTDLMEWTPLATSVNGNPPTGTATISEGTGTMRFVTLQTPAGDMPTFYRLHAFIP